MIALVMSSAVYLAAMQAAVNVPRAAFSDCLKTAHTQALASKIGTDAYAEFVKGQCANQMTKFKNALVGFDVKNGVGRKRAAEDADLQIDDYISGATSDYRRVVAAAGENG